MKNLPMDITTFAKDINFFAKGHEYFAIALSSLVALKVLYPRKRTL